LERIKRALELAKAEREQVLQQGPVAAVSNEPAVPGAAPTPDAAPGTQARSRSVPVSAATLRAGGMLLPGMVGPVAHSFKMLRTQVTQRLRQRGWNTLAVMSPAPDEGKTFTAINLAIAIAADRDATALLVDLDLRAPRLHKRFGFEPTVGVEDCLRGDAEIADALVSPEGYPGLLLLPARQSVEHSSELLASAKARAMFAEIKQRYPNRTVIYDLPPVLGSDDALAFAPQVDAALVVIGDNRTKREELQRCFELMREIPVVGTVLNGSRNESSAAYAY
jgi:Mrp family chromosome partitioning ATPase